MWIPNPHTQLAFYEGSMTLWAIHQRLWSWNGYLAQTPETLMYWAFKLLGLQFFGNSVPFLLGLMSLWGGVSNVQHRCADAVERVCEGLERRSLYYDVMESLGICIFTQLDDYVCQGVLSHEIRSSSSLNTVSIDAKMTMSWFQQMGVLNNLIFMHTHQIVNEEQCRMGRGELWWSLFFVHDMQEVVRECTLLARLDSEYQKLAGVVVAMVMGFIDYECTFSTTTYMNTRLRNSLHEHLNLAVRMFGQLFYQNLQHWPSTMLSLNGSKSTRDVLLACLCACACAFLVSRIMHLRSVSGEILGNNRSDHSVVDFSVFS